MRHFEGEQRAVHYPADRSFTVWVSRREVYALCAIVVIPLLIAWMQVLLAGLPSELSNYVIDPLHPPDPRGFAARLNEFRTLSGSCN